MAQGDEHVLLIILTKKFSSGKEKFFELFLTKPLCSSSFQGRKAHIAQSITSSPDQPGNSIVFDTNHSQMIN